MKPADYLPDVFSSHRSQKILPVAIGSTIVGTLLDIGSEVNEHFFTGSPISETSKLLLPLVVGLVLRKPIKHLVYGIDCQTEVQITEMPAVVPGHDIDEGSLIS